jgi:uncharacterized membrane protein YphA (DoxX/SURF4 family)
VNVIFWMLQVLLAGIFVMSGFIKIFQYERAKLLFAWMRDLSRGSALGIGLLEIAGGLGLFLPEVLKSFPWLSFAAAVALLLLMICAAIFHGRRAEEPQVVLTAGIGFVLALIIYSQALALFGY